MATRKKLDAEKVLRELAEMRKKIPFLEPTPRPVEDGLARTHHGFSPKTAEDWEWAAVADGLDGLATDLRAAIARKEAEAMEAAMKIYYAAEELSQQPEHAHLIEHVEKMRKAYQDFYGRPIPPKPKE